MAVGTAAVEVSTVAALILLAEALEAADSVVAALLDPESRLASSPAQ
jgi:hypothetical protein